MAGAGTIAVTFLRIEPPLRQSILAFVTLLLAITLAPGAARADVASLENRLKSHCMRASAGNEQGCTCLVSALRREAPPGEHEASLALILVGLEGPVGSADGIAIPADVQNRHALTRQKLKQLVPAAMAGFGRARAQCSGRRG